MGTNMKTKTKDYFTCAYRRDHLLLKDDYKVVKDEIIDFLDSKAENYEVIKKGEIEKLPHFNELPCSLEMLLSEEIMIRESFNAYIWALIQSGEIDVTDWDSLDDIISAEQGYLTSE